MTNSSFNDFLSKFPAVELPITLGEDDHHVFSTENQPLPQHLLDVFVLPYDEAVDEEFTEFVSCFSIENSDKYVAVVFWKASLMNYEYILATFSLDGTAISRKVIARTHVEGNAITRAVATIDEEMVITVAEGKSVGNDAIFDALSTKTYCFEILANGEVIQYNAALN